MLSRVKRAVLAFLALTLLVAGCDDDKKKSAAKKPKGPQPPTQHFTSRPDLKPPPVDVLTFGSTTPGYIFFAPKMKVVQAGPLILTATT